MTLNQLPMHRGLIASVQIVHESVYDDVLQRLVKAFGRVMERTGDPLDRTFISRCICFFVKPPPHPRTPLTAIFRVVLR